jgi:hypothetical protein
MVKSRLSRSSRAFVALLFLALAISFFASTGLILWEMRDIDPLLVLSTNSNLFVYFPTLGVVALAAFYVPAVILTDLYWSGRIKLGRTRYMLGFLVFVGAAVAISEKMNVTELRPFWEISPAALHAKDNDPRTCRPNPPETETGNPSVRPDCRPAILGAIGDLRVKALDRVALSPLARECNLDKLLEPPPDYTVARYCFPAHRLLTTPACCLMQRELVEQSVALWESPRTRSLTANWDRLVFLPAKCFFLVVILMIGVLLIYRKKLLVAHYSDLLPAMERRLQWGALAMLPWLIMDYAQQQVADVLYGAPGGFPFRPSLVLLPWALLIAGYFADRIQIELVRIVQMVSAVISGIAILNYRSVFDWSAKLVGVGAPEWHFWLLGGISIVGLVYILWGIPGALRGEDLGKDEIDPAVPPVHGGGPFT